MVIVGGTFEVEPDQREAFLAGRPRAMRTSSAEPGCLEYTPSADPIDPTRVMLFERWTSQESLDAHLTALRSAPTNPGNVAPKSSALVIYGVVGERKLGG